LSSALPASAQHIWEATLSQLLLRVTRQNYDSWLRNTTGLRFEGTTLVVAAANELACDWLSTRMKSVIAQGLTAVAGPGLQVRYQPYEQPDDQVAGGSPLQPSLLPSQPTPLNPRFTFASYLDADFNRLALTAARDIAGEAQSNYSPLFITGAAGNGKTHLLHAIAHAAASQGVRFLLVGAEQFLNEFTNAVRNKNGAAFRARYRELDLLMVDDVHLLLGKKATLNEFYQTVAGLHDQGRRVAVAGDLSAMNSEAARFRDQLRWGLVAPIGEPSTEDRIRFVEAKAAGLGMPLPDEVKHYLALRVRSSIRDLEGAVNRVTAIARISIDQPLDIDFTARALQPVSTLFQADTPPVAPTDLLNAVCRHLGLSPSEITSQKRNRALTYARHLAMYLLREDGGLTYSAIAQFLGKKDHSTVVHACTQLLRELNISPSLRADIDAVRASLHIPTHAA
jgi:chromosomal replication initiator protein